MINNRSDLSDFIKQDMANRGCKNIARSFLLDPVSRFTVLLRYCEYLKNTKRLLPLRVLCYFYFKRLSVRLGFSVPLNVFGPGLVIVHYGLLIVNSQARIGKNCRIHAGVNIGGAAGLVDEDKVKDLVPKIGDNCYIGPGAKIYGGITIGDNVAIGANAVVNKSFDDNVSIAGVPAKVISENGSLGMICSEE